MKKPIRLVDSHCHLNLLDVADPIHAAQVAVDQAHAAGVCHMLSVGVTLADMPHLLSCIEAFPNVMGSVGLHPTEIVESEPTIDDLLQYAQHPRIKAIGETGLDYYRASEEKARLQQQARFRTHIHAAKQCNKPLIIHTRAAQTDTLAILRSESAATVGGVFHCFTENLEMAFAGIELGFYISFSGIITFKNATELRAVVEALPLERILIETDAPYLAPVPFRGKPNTPAYVYHVAEALAQIKQVSIEEIARITLENFEKCFGYSIE